MLRYFPSGRLTDSPSIRAETSYPSALTVGMYTEIDSGSFPVTEGSVWALAVTPAIWSMNTRTNRRLRALFQFFFIFIHLISCLLYRDHAAPNSYNTIIDALFSENNIRILKSREPESARPRGFSQPIGTILPSTT